MSPDSSEPKDLADLFGPADSRPSSSAPHLRDLFTDDEILAAHRADLPEEEAKERAETLIRALDARLPIGIMPGALIRLANLSPDCARRVREYLGGRDPRDHLDRLRDDKPMDGGSFED
ncbi:MAG TPA: hypothetical protein VHG28_05325 [Longimicrobiaceae bacterium]|nr:hypothetical protein [Longimicrobiaceae bacterium]